MKTDDLIAVLAADRVPGPRPARRLALVLPAAALSLLAVVTLWGVRADLAVAWQSAAVLKTLVPLALALAAGLVALALVRPAAPLAVRGLALVALLAALAVWLAAALVTGGLSGMVAALSTPTTRTCLLSVPALSLPILAAVLWALRGGAPLQATRAGLVAGLAAGALGAAIYSLYCDKDMALFVLPAYGTAVAAVAALGGVVGARVLRW
ncbi:MAG: DUF1109 domain-containing protein [Rhodobacteraceae bacterium]|jgi:hypothetical protein|nr:DUF1109 domain-containing protein [Paracoccaceae bacterium]